MRLVSVCTVAFAAVVFASPSAQGTAEQKRLEAALLLELDGCQKSPDARVSGRCAYDVYVKFGAWEQVQDKKCKESEGEVAKIADCEKKRANAKPPIRLIAPMKTKQGDIAKAELSGDLPSVTSQLLGGKASTLPVPEVTPKTVLQTGQPTQDSARVDTSITLITISAFAAAGIALFVVVGLAYLYRSRGQEIDELSGQLGDRDRSIAHLTADLTKKTSDASTLEAEIALRDRRKLEEAIKLADSASPSALASVPASEKAHATRIEPLSGAQILEALVGAFKACVEKGTILPFGREFDTFVNNFVRDERARDFLKASTKCEHMLLNSNGERTTANPTLLAIMPRNSGSCYVFPFPFAERTGMYRKWFDGFSESKAVIATEPAVGRVHGESIEVVKLGRLS